MIDINFFMKFHKLKKKLMNNDVPDAEDLFRQMEKMRSPLPIVYNIETTNFCNMRCEMCPRTTMMTRKNETLAQPVFEKIVDQLTPFSKDLWNEWKTFTEQEYGIYENDMSENHFFLYIIPKVIQLHGYGAPLLDPHIVKRVKYLKDRGFSSYFSCNPANINVEKNIELFENGLDYIKYSIESVDDEEHKKIRGKASNFTESYKKILKLLDEKAKRRLDSTIVITMIDLHKEDQEESYAKLYEAFKGCDVYIYLKSQDQQWYKDVQYGTKSIHWSEICQHPWMSISVKSNAEVAMCMEDFNNEIILGDAGEESLEDIWNGAKYQEFRKDHFTLKPGIKCTEQCDMKLIGDFLTR